MSEEEIIAQVNELVANGIWTPEKAIEVLQTLLAEIAA